MEQAALRTVINQRGKVGTLINMVCDLAGKYLTIFKEKKMKLLDTLKEKYDLKNDAAISRALEVAPPVISRIRNGKLEPSSDIILRIHEKLGMPVADIRACL